MSSSSTTTMEDVSLSYVLSSFRVETANLKTENGALLSSYLSNDIGQPSYAFSNLASKTVFDMMANGATKGSPEQKGLLFHSHGKPLPWLNEVYPYLFQFLTETGPAGGPRINLSRRIWVDPSVSLKQAFRDLIDQFFSPEIVNLDFSIKESAKTQVNGWIQERSGGLIEDSLGETGIRADTRLIIAATLSFQGEWYVPFEDAGERDFTYLNGQVGRLPFMTSTGSHYIKRIVGKYTMLNVPFEQHEASRFSMLFYLPDHTKDFIEMRSFIGLEEAVYHDVYFPDEQVQVGRFFIPKITLNVRGPMPLQFRDKEGKPTGPFTFLEMADTPAAGLASDLGRLSGYLNINETGARAAATTYFYFHKNPESGEAAPSSIVPFSGDDQPIDFVANRPFIFFIRDNQFRRMLFSGALINPTGLSPSFKPSAAE